MSKLYFSSNNGSRTRQTLTPDSQLFKNKCMLNIKYTFSWALTFGSKYCFSVLIQPWYYLSRPDPGPQTPPDPHTVLFSLWQTTICSCSSHPSPSPSPGLGPVALQTPAPGLTKYITYFIIKKRKLLSQLQNLTSQNRSGLTRGWRWAAAPPAGRGRRPTESVSSHLHQERSAASCWPPSAPRGTRHWPPGGTGPPWFRFRLDVSLRPSSCPGCGSENSWWVSLELSGVQTLDTAARRHTEGGATTALTTPMWIYVALWWIITVLHVFYFSWSFIFS